MFTFPIQSSTWTQSSWGPFGSVALAQRGREALQLLQRRGVVLQPGNRLERAVKLTESFNSGKLKAESLDAAGINAVLEAFRTVLEAFIVMWTATERPRRVDPFPVSKLRCFVEGAETSALDSNPWPRNTQFELVVGANFVMGGAEVLPEEPDFKVLYHGEHIGLAAKRVRSTSLTTLRGVLRDAGQQLEKHGRGFVVLNLDNWVSDLSHEITEEFGQSFNAQLREAHSQMELASARMAVMGVITFVYWSQWLPQCRPPRIDWRFPTQILLFADTDDDRSRAADYFRGLRHSQEGSFTELSQLLRPLPRPQTA